MESKLKNPKNWTTRNQTKALDELPMNLYFNNKSRNQINLNGIHGPHGENDGFNIIKVKF